MSALCFKLRIDHIVSFENDNAHFDKESKLFDNDSAFFDYEGWLDKKKENFTFSEVFLVICMYNCEQFIVWEIPLGSNSYSNSWKWIFISKNVLSDWLHMLWKIGIFRTVCIFKFWIGVSKTKIFCYEKWNFFNNEKDSILNINSLFSKYTHLVII